jgi:hypothetical protein
VLSQDEDTQAALRARIERAEGETLDDVAQHMRLLASASPAGRLGALDLDASASAGMARPSRRSRFAALCADGVGELTSRLAISTEQFAENLGTIGESGGEQGIAIHTLGAQRAAARPGEVFDPRREAREFLTRGGYGGTLFGERAHGGDIAAAVEAVLAAAREVLVQVWRCAALWLPSPCEFRRTPFLLISAFRSLYTWQSCGQTGARQVSL